MAVGDETFRDFNASTHIRDPLLGTKVDEYEIQVLVGQGAMGIVYRGVHTLIGKPVAIKVLKPDYASDPEMVRRVIREARTVNAIRHPGIVDIFGFGTLKLTGQPYIVMDLLEGEPLDVFIRREAPVPLEVAAPILDELLGALGAAHQVGVVHRDLKPGNVFVESHPDSRSRVKVIDFGLARQADRAGGSIRPTNPGTLLGTPAFMAPEQVLGEKVTPATDLYAVGGIAYQLLTGHLPHEAPSAIDVIAQKMSRDPVRPRQWNSTVDEEVEGWMMALLHRESSERPQSAEEVRQKLRRIADARSSGAVLRSTGGVVPKRDWQDARTILFDGGAPAGGLLGDTSRDQPSPYAKTIAGGFPGVDGEREQEAPSITPVEPPPLGSARNEATTAPDAQLAATSRLPWVVLGVVAAGLISVLIYVLVRL